MQEVGSKETGLKTSVLEVEKNVEHVGEDCATEKVDDLLLGPAELGEPLWKCVVI